MCNLCSLHEETIAHLFLDCKLAKEVWNWLVSILKLQCNFPTIQEVVQVCQRNLSPLCKIVILAEVINILNTIWFCRNQHRFNNKKINVRSTINLIISATALTGNNSRLAANSSIEDFLLLNAFSVKINHGRAPRIKEVIWQPPVFNWIKCNVDGASVGNPGAASCGGIYRDKNGVLVGAFAYNLGISNSLFGELNGARYAIELARKQHFRLEN